MVCKMITGWTSGRRLLSVVPPFPFHTQVQDRLLKRPYLSGPLSTVWDWFRHWNFIVRHIMLFRRCWVYTTSEMKIMTQGNDFNYSLHSVYEVISEEGTRAEPTFSSWFSSQQGCHSAVQCEGIAYGNWYFRGWHRGAYIRIVKIGRRNRP